MQWIILLVAFLPELTTGQEGLVWIQNNSPFFAYFKSYTGKGWTKLPSNYIASGALSENGKWSGTEVSFVYSIFQGDISGGNPKFVGNFSLGFLSTDPQPVFLQSYISPINELQKSQRIFLTWFSQAGNQGCDPSRLEGWSKETVDLTRSPICLLVRISDLQFSSLSLLEETTSLPEIDHLQRIQNCIFSTKSDFDNSFVLDGRDLKYNSVAWSIFETANWYIDPLINDSFALKFYTNQGYQQTDCGNPLIEVALHCVIGKNNDCVPLWVSGASYKFTAASRRIFDGRWSLKFSYEPLFVFESLSQITNQKCVGSPQNFVIGVPFLCFMLIKT